MGLTIQRSQKRTRVEALKLPDKPPQFPEKPTLQGIKEFNAQLEKFWFDVQAALQRHGDSVEGELNKLANE
jgi:hypothetical protein